MISIPKSFQKFLVFAHLVSPFFNTQCLFYFRWFRQNRYLCACIYNWAKRIF